MVSDGVPISKPARIAGVLRLLARIAPVLHLTRVTTAFATVANVWFVILWTRSVEQEAGGAVMGLSDAVALGGGALVAVGLFSFGAAMNDILDVRRDKALHPGRPLPSGQVSPETAAALVAGTLIAAILGATMLGATPVLLSLLTAGAILFYNAAGKFLPSVRVVLLGLIYAAHMLIPNAWLIFLWPVWLVMTHSLAVGALSHRLARRRPSLTGPALAAAVAGWVFWSGTLGWMQWTRAGTLWPEWVSPAAPVAAGALAALFIVFAWRKIVTADRGERAAEKIARYGALWLALYDAAWLLGQGAWGGGAILLGLALAGFLGMTILREFYGIVEQPLGYRR